MNWTLLLELWWLEPYNVPWIICCWCAVVCSCIEESNNVMAFMTVINMPFLALGWLLNLFLYAGALSFYPDSTIVLHWRILYFHGRGCNLLRASTDWDRRKSTNDMQRNGDKNWAVWFSGFALWKVKWPPRVDGDGIHAIWVKSLRICFLFLFQVFLVQFLNTEHVILQMCTL